MVSASKIKLNRISNKVKHFFNSVSYKAFKKYLFESAFDGMLISVALIPFGVPFKYFFCYGTLYYLLSNNIQPLRKYLFVNEK